MAAALPSKDESLFFSLQNEILLDFLNSAALISLHVVPMPPFYITLDVFEKMYLWRLWSKFSILCLSLFTSHGIP